MEDAHITIGQEPWLSAHDLMTLGPWADSHLLSPLLCSAAGSVERWRRTSGTFPSLPFSRQAFLTVSTWCQHVCGVGWGSEYEEIE